MRTLLLSTLALLIVACGRDDNRGAVEDPSLNRPSEPSTAPPAPALAPLGEAPADVSIRLSPTEGNTASGELTLTPEGEGVNVAGTVSGLAPNSAHGIHIHENGDCSAPDASSAGGHFGPLGNPHGAPGPTSHVGDLGNITANEQGVAQVHVRAVQATLRTEAPTDIAGRAIIVHANADDLQSQPSGASGARIACGVIS